MSDTGPEPVVSVVAVNGVDIIRIPGERGKGAYRD